MSKHQNVGYKRVSTASQKDARQLDGVALDKCFDEVFSGRTAADRPQLRACIDYCRDGDVLHVHSIDRLARNMEDLLGIVSELKTKGVAVRFYTEGLEFKADESDPMADLMLQMLGAFAQFERTLIDSRRKEGVAAARKAGKHIGRKGRFSLEQTKDMQARYQAGTPVRRLAAEHGVTRQTIYDQLRKVAP